MNNFTSIMYNKFILPRYFKLRKEFEIELISLTCDS